MKKFFWLIVIAVLFNSCSVDEEPKFHYEILAVDSYIVPESFVFRNNYEINIFYKRPTTCHAFQGLYYNSFDNTRTMAIQCAVANNSYCQTYDGEASEVSLNFYANSLETYLFKFYKGKDENGEAIYENIEIPVTN